MALSAYLANKTNPGLTCEIYAASKTLNSLTYKILTTFKLHYEIGFRELSL